MIDGFLRVAVATPEIRVADVNFNQEQIIRICREAAAAGAGLVVLPELCLTGYTCGDLFLSQTLQDAAIKALHKIVEDLDEYNLVAVIGLPLAVSSGLYNTAAVFCQGRILGFVPKSAIPNYAEFYEARHFSPGPVAAEITIEGHSIPFGTNLIFSCRSLPEFQLAVEICEDIWTAEPPSVKHAAAGATVIANLSASDEIIGKADYRRVLVQSQSGRLTCAYLYADAGNGESTTDLVFAGHNLIYENGHLLKESQPFQTGIQTADLDLRQLVAERRRLTTFPGKDLSCAGYRTIEFDLPLQTYEHLQRPISPQPFVPANQNELGRRCEQILNLQMQGLKKRLAHTDVKTALIGLSGGLDSTLALLVAARAYTALNWPLSGVLAVTMPGFGTTERTYGNACALADLLGAELLEIPIADSVLQHFRDIGHDPEVLDVTYENAQARERTQILMDVANQRNGLVIGTSDLSELALGWTTYNGDHMSMYAVNASIPKTLLRHLVRYAADTALAAGNQALHDILDDILATPVSPELLPAENGTISQKTESIIGPYELHDFFLYYLVRFGMSPKKVYRLAQQAFAGKYDDAAILLWLRIFVRRFFNNQFKRSCQPDGPKVGTVSLSPRGDWRMPSDAQSEIWLAELAELE
jgi:NAD+ synthase (glutamine-hydrolysing)